MKKAFLLIALAISFVLCGCSDTDTSTESVVSDAPIVAYGEHEMSDEMYRLVLSLAKADTLTKVWGSNDVEDSFWQSEDGSFYADTIKTDATLNAMALLYYNEKFNEYKLEAEDGIYEAKKAEYIKRLGEQKLKKLLDELDVSMEVFENYIILSSNADIAANHIHNGDIDPLNEEDFKRYYVTNYITLRHLFINTVTYEGGMPMNDAKIEAVTKRADEIEKQLEEGKKLTDFMAECDDGILEAYPEGVTIPLGDELYALAEYSDSEMNLYAVFYYLLYKNPQYAEAALTSEEGAVTRVRTNDGIFFVQRMPIDFDEGYEQFLPMIKNSAGLRKLKVTQVVKAEEANGTLTQNKDKIAAMFIRDIKAFR